MEGFVACLPDLDHEGRGKMRLSEKRRKGEWAD